MGDLPASASRNEKNLDDMDKKAKCLKCVHCLEFNAKDGVRYVCTLKGKRLWEDDEKCKEFGEGVKNY